MNKKDKKPKLSTCLSNVQSTLKGKIISATQLARTVCEKHDPQGGQKLYREILGALPSPNSTKSRLFSEWLMILLDSCSELVNVLHTDLALLLIARHSPNIAAVFSRNDGKTSSVSIDTVLRGNMYEFIADLHRDHEIVSKDEFWELVLNVRKTDSRNEFRGRGNAAIIYSSERELSRIEEWAIETPDRACVPLRIRLNAEDLDTKFAAASVKGLETFRSKKPGPEGLMKDLAIATQKLMNRSPSSHDTLNAWQHILEMNTHVGHRLILILEIENVDTRAIISLQQWVARAVSHRHDRLIVVVGGIPINAELEHPQGAWAYRLKPVEKTEGVAETFANDATSGKDLLELTQEIDALSNVIASVDLKPPLVVGICGGWGAGKSFVLSLIDQRLREIRKQDLSQKDALHVGHIYWIEFDAWTYSKKNLWASLMDQICRQLEEQLNIERIQFTDRNKPTPRIPSDLPPWVVSKKLAGTELSDLDEYTGWTVSIDGDRKNLGELLIAINDEGFADEQNSLMRELESAQQVEINLTKARKDSIEKDFPARVSKYFVNSISLKLLKSIGIDRETLEAFEEIPKVFEKLEEDQAIFKSFCNSIQSPIIIPIILIGLGALGLHLKDAVDYGFALPTGVMSLVTSVGLAISRVLSARDKIHDHVAKGRMELAQRSEAVRKALTEEYDKKNAFDDKLKKNRESQKEIQGKLKKLRKESGIPFLEIESLQGFLEEIRSGEVYTKQLGLMNQVQQHLQKLSRLITGWSKRPNASSAADDGETYSPFLRGVPRIILKIDDLDRCPPQKVVEVLEATQLLVKTDLFVVVLALDLRYVTRAIEKCYDGILSHDEHPTGLDYIEKIIQLPYQVRPIAKDHLESFFSGHIEYIPDTLKEEIEEETEPHSALVSKIPARTIHIPERPMLRQVLQLREAEFKDLVDACKPLDLLPRAGKRISNVYKIWKLLWHQGEKEPSKELKRTMVALLALSTVRPRLARHGLRQLAHLARSNKNEQRKLNSMFHDFAKGLDEPPHIQSLFESQRLFPKNLVAGTISPRDLSLLSSFSFVGDDDLQGIQNGKSPNAELPDGEIANIVDYSKLSRGDKIKSIPD